MIIGGCPYEGCDGDVWLGCDEWPMPSFYRHVCEECGQNIWTEITHMNPQSWTEEAFLATHEINEEIKTIKEIDNP